MKTLTRCIATAFLVTFTAASAAAQAQKTPQCVDDDEKPLPFARNLYRVCVNANHAWMVDEPSNSRFTNRDAVEVEVRYFNFLRYTLSFDIKEEKSEAYQYLTKLWTSILSPNLLQAFALGETEGVRADTDEFVQRMRDLFRRTQALDKKITQVAGAYKNPGLTVKEMKLLKADALGGVPETCPAATTDLQGKPDFPLPQPGSPLDDPLINCPVAEILRGLNLSNARLSQFVLTTNGAFTEAISGQRKTMYTLVTDGYTNVRKRADTFLTLARKSVAVETKKAGKHEAGTRVTLTLSAVDEGGARSPMTDVNYFVETTMPLVFHGGLVFSGLQDVNFDKIKRATAFGEEEVFQKTSDSDSSTGFTAFLSWTLTQFSKTAGPNNSKASLLISLGTDITNPGKKIYAGPSILLFNRMALTGGVAFGKVAEGVTQTLDPNVFRVIQEKPKGSFFFSLTSKVP